MPNLELEIQLAMEKSMSTEDSKFQWLFRQTNVLGIHNSEIVYREKLGNETIVPIGNLVLEVNYG